MNNVAQLENLEGAIAAELRQLQGEINRLSDLAREAQQQGGDWQSEAKKRYELAELETALNAAYSQQKIAGQRLQDVRNDLSVKRVQLTEAKRTLELFRNPPAWGFGDDLSPADIGTIEAQAKKTVKTLGGV